VELGPALLVVGGSYACYLLGWRRLRAWVGQRRGPDLAALSAFDLDALSREEGLVAGALAPEEGGLLQAVQVEARRAHVVAAGPKRDAAVQATLGALRQLGDAPLRSPAWTALAPHLLTLRLSLAWMELEEFAARRALRKALAVHPAAPALHLVGAHLEAKLGHPDAAVDWLARALYYANGDPFYARPIAASPYIARRRPALDLQARKLLDPARGSAAAAQARTPTGSDDRGIDAPERIEQDSPTTKDGP